MKNVAFIIAVVSLIGINPIFGQKSKLKVGKKAPSFDLPTLEGENIALDNLLIEKDYVLVHFFIGSWHSYDKKYLADLQTIYADFQAKNGEIIAITGDRAVFLKSLQSEIQFEFPIGLDPDLQTMSSYSVVTKITSNYVPLKHKEYSALNEKHTGSKDDMIPIPATYLINKAGKIVWFHFDQDYRRRPDVNTILEQL